MILPRAASLLVDGLPTSAALNVAVKHSSSPVLRPRTSETKRIDMFKLLIGLFRLLGPTRGRKLDVNPTRRIDNNQTLSAVVVETAVKVVGAGTPMFSQQPLQ